MTNQKSHLTQSIEDELNNHIETISEDIAQRSRAKRTANDLLKAIEDEDIEVASRLLKNRVKQLVDVYPRLNSTLEKIRIDMNRRQEDQLRQVASQLEKYCQESNITIKGKPPKYTIDHLIEMEFDRKKLRTKVGINSLSTFRWTPIQDAINEEHKRLWERNFDASKFRDQLIEAYDELEEINPSPSGWASLENVYQSLKELEVKENPDWRKGGRLIAYYKDEFSADLSLLWQAQSKSAIEPPHIEFSSIRDPRRAYKIIQPDRNVGSYGFLRPKRK